MTTAFVLSGGCSLGAVQVGMLQALSARGVRPDLLVGTSAGALNAAYVAGHGTGMPALIDLAEVWTGLRRRAIFVLDPRRALRATLGGVDSLCSDGPLRALLHRHLAFADLAEAPIPLRVIATDLLSGEEVVFADGDPVEAVLASTALPGLLPAVHHQGRVLVDGSLANNTAISQAVAAGADQVYVLPSGYACALTSPPRGAMGMLAQATTVLIHQRTLADIAAYAGQVELIVLPPPCPLGVSPLDFGRAAELIVRSRRDALTWLDQDGGRRADPVATVGLHHDVRV